MKERERESDGERGEREGDRARRYPPVISQTLLTGIILADTLV
jgi:hypothetical protein